MRLGAAATMAETHRRKTKWIKNGLADRQPTNLMTQRTRPAVSIDVQWRVHHSSAVLFIDVVIFVGIVVVILSNSLICPGSAVGRHIFSSGGGGGGDPVAGAQDRIQIEARWETFHARRRVLCRGRRPGVKIGTGSILSGWLSARHRPYYFLKGRERFTRPAQTLFVHLTGCSLIVLNPMKQVAVRWKKFNPSKFIPYLHLFPRKNCLE